MAGELVRQFRLGEASTLTGYTVASLRKKILNRELGFHKTGRIISIPETEIRRLLGEYQAPISQGHNR